MRTRKNIVNIVALACSLTFIQRYSLGQAPQHNSPDALPLRVAAEVVTHDTRSPIDLSPDGQWVAETHSTGEILTRDTNPYSATGFPFAEGNFRMEVSVTNTKTGRVVHLGTTTNSSWGAVWSPDSKRLAFYSDEGGVAGLWIWERATEKSMRFPGIIIRPFFGFEVVRWMSDGERLLCKILPQGMSVSQANTLQLSAFSRFLPTDPGHPSVFVLKSGAEQTETVRPPVGDVVGYTEGSIADLAILDVHSHSVTRLAIRVPIRYYAVSPDETRVAYTVLRGWERNTQQPRYDLMLYTINQGTTSKAGDRLRMNYGIEWNWSPDSSRLAYFDCGQRGNGSIGIVPVSAGAIKYLNHDSVPNFGSPTGVRAPLWDSRGREIYALSDGALWSVNAESDIATKIADIPGYKISAIVSRPEFPAAWSSDKGPAIWAVANQDKGPNSAVYKIDIVTHRVTSILQEKKSFLTSYNLDASDVTHEVALVAQDQQHLADVWILDTTNGKARQITTLNAGLDKYKLGQAITVDWLSLDGTRLHGALLLPPDYKRGQRLPLVVWVYGGLNGSEFVNSFGFWGSSPTFNMHVLATRGYAVLFPDVPLRTGETISDLISAVIPGINATIDQGYADPDRLALMGQSYGSYCALSLLTQTARFRAAVISADDLNPDLISTYLEMAPDGESSLTGLLEHGQGNMGGTPWDYPERYRKNSPIFAFDKIQTPILIGEGEKDGRLIASDATFVALRRLGKEVEYRIYGGEDHVISREVNVIDFWQRRLEFLAEHLDLAVDEQGRIIFDTDRGRSRTVTTNSAPARDTLIGNQ